MKNESSEPKCRVFILYTGGTIGMAPAQPEIAGSPLVPKPLEELMKYVPGLDSLGIELRYESFEKPVDSSDLDERDFIRMAEIIHGKYQDYDGFVILQGTDTLAYSASTLSFIFENLGKPVVITGSQLPISDVRTDAKMNLVNAVHVAGYKATKLPCIPEVIVVFSDKILRGCATKKVSSTSLAGFDSPNQAPLGVIGEHIVIDTASIRKMPAPGKRFQINTVLSNKVKIVTLTPGFRPSHLKRDLESDDVEALILLAFGAGNSPSNDAFLKVIEETKKIIVIASQCPEAMVEMGLYINSSTLLERGALSALDATYEAVFAKLMWLLGSMLPEQIPAQMQVSQRGEQTQNMFDVAYGEIGNSSEAKVSFHQFRTPDARFKADRLSRASIRMSGLGLSGLKQGARTHVRVFMNLPSANWSTPTSHDRCVLDREIEWQGQPISVIQELDDTTARSCLGDGDITLSVVTDEGVSFWMSGLFLTLFAQA